MELFMLRQRHIQRRGVMEAYIFKKEEKGRSKEKYFKNVTISKGNRKKGYFFLWTDH